MSQCRRPPKGTPKEVLVALHKSKMMGKFFARKERGLTPAERAIARGARPRPNRSKKYDA